MKYIKKFTDFLILEKLYHIDDDVDMLYDKYFKKTVDDILYTGEIKYSMIKKDMIYTSVLQNDLCKKAHELNPCKIIINQKSNGYTPNEKIICISVSLNLVELIIYDYGGSIKNANHNFTSKERERFLQEFTEHRIKGSIHHELTHWIDDTLNNKHIDKYLKGDKIAKEYNSINTNYLEIQAQIHNIKQLYNSHKLIWNSLTFFEMLKLNPLFSFIDRLTPEVKKEWIKNIKKRMHREGLLGKNMK